MAVAADVGMSRPGLRHFLQGGAPHGKTLRKLEEWFVRQAAKEGRPSREAMQAAIALLLEGVPERERADARVRLLEALRSIYEQKGAKLPNW